MIKGKKSPKLFFLRVKIKCIEIDFYERVIVTTRFQQTEIMH